MRFHIIALAAAVLLACVVVSATADFPRTFVRTGAAIQAEAETVQPVSGSGVHFLTTAIVHSAIPTATGLIQRSTETVDLAGDLKGRILYHPTSVIDFSTQTLVNTGHQVFSGTVLGSEPVLLHDDTFRFDIDLRIGTGIGTVHLVDRVDGPKVRCDLTIVSTGLTAEGNVAAEYTGECRFKNKWLQRVHLPRTVYDGSEHAVTAPATVNSRWCSVGYNHRGVTDAHAASCSRMAQRSIPSP